MIVQPVVEPMDRFTVLVVVGVATAAAAAAPQQWALCLAGPLLGLITPKASFAAHNRAPHTTHCFLFAFSLVFVNKRTKGKFNKDVMMTLMVAHPLSWWEAVGGLYVQQQRILDWGGSRLATGCWSQGSTVTSLSTRSPAEPRPAAARCWAARRLWRWSCSLDSSCECGVRGCKLGHGDDVNMADCC